MQGANGTPAVPEERLVILDILRGLAVLGMILAHGQKMMAALAPHWPENPAGWAIIHLVAEKDRAIFALLFGVSFAVMMGRIEARHQPVFPVFLRRLAVLYLIGFFVEAFTRFHILREYAFWGVALLFLRTYPTRTLLVVAAICAASFSIRDLADSSYAVLTQGWETARNQEISSQQTWWLSLQQKEQALASPEYVAVVKSRVQHMLGSLISAERLTPGIYLTFFILGLLAIRHRIFTEAVKHRRLILGFMLAGATAWAAAWWLLPLLPEQVITPRIGYRLHTGLGFIDEQFLAFTWIGGITLLLATRPAGAAILAPLGWVGRMALTNYILHAVVIDFACATYGLNLRLNPPLLLLFSAALFLTLAIGSKAWLTHFRYGPVEWIWRCLTYWHWQPIKKG
ncbi:DUF418 domain-containing protein [Oleiharenicola lentus]|uniref:DUF418 domain-containing protein n=1 Tax=Oleiharenicola lentus TaxID=2508720 RepID=A0A4Q1C3A1_9BACT|nr:DUF418 domain-containing protein [Oleiharenicola lentus]RXK52817.1 DUF418 domain-containing protein [Oleiharenicola lentus]